MNAPTHALTLWEPWGSAIIWGPKRIENRPWAPPREFVQERIFIHAGKHYDEERALDVVDLWEAQDPAGFRAFRDARAEFKTFRTADVTGCIIGSVKLEGYIYSGAPAGTGAAEPSLVGTFGMSEAEAKRVGEWWMGPYGWVLSDPVPLKEPVPARGLQKLWRVPAEVLEQIRGLG